MINHGEVILDTPVARMKRDYLKVKTVELLLEETITGLESRALLGDAEGVGMEGVSVLKAKGHGLKLAVDTAQTLLEPLMSALMRQYHIVDMTIADPPMEEVIAAIYGQPKGVSEEPLEIYQGAGG